MGGRCVWSKTFQGASSLKTMDKQDLATIPTRVIWDGVNRGRAYLQTSAKSDGELDIWMKRSRRAS